MKVNEIGLLYIRVRHPGPGGVLGESDIEDVLILCVSQLL